MMMAWVAGMGLIWGSFANVVIYRLPRDQSVVTPSSRCPKCEKKIPWYGNIPILSFLALKRKCVYCRAPISWRYPMVEFLTAVLFVLTYLRLGPSLWLWVRDLPFMLLMVCITFIDIDFRIIPDELNLLGGIIGLITAYFDPRASFQMALIGALLGGGVFWLIAEIYYRWKGVEGMGMGDTKFLAMLGCFIGPYGVFQTIFISSVLGSVVGIGWAYYNKSPDKLKTAIPYGPFLVIGGMYSYLFGDEWLRSMIPI